MDDGVVAVVEFDDDECLTLLFELSICESAAKEKNVLILFIDNKINIRSDNFLTSDNGLATPGIDIVGRRGLGC